MYCCLKLLVFNPLSDFKANGVIISFNLLSCMMSLYHENSRATWILTINNIKPIFLAATPSVLQRDVLKSCQLSRVQPSICVSPSHALGRVHSSGLSSAHECNPAGTQVLWCWCVASTYRRDGMSDDACQLIYRCARAEGPDPITEVSMASTMIGHK